MESPFPGMDPYLESRHLWRSFHHNFATEIARQLNPLIYPKYYADVEVRTVLQEIGITVGNHQQYPDAAVFRNKPTINGATTILEPTLTKIETKKIIAPLKRTVPMPDAEKTRAIQIYETATDALITAIELLSPVNKIGQGLHKYREKRMQILHSDVHLIELDLIRRGTHPGPELESPPLDTDYVLIVNRAEFNAQRVSEIWPIALNQPLPTIPVPLLLDDSDAPLDLMSVLHQVQFDFRYPGRIDYTQLPPSPVLREEMGKWWASRQQAWRS